MERWLLAIRMAAVCVHACVHGWACGQIGKVVERVGCRWAAVVAVAGVGGLVVGGGTAADFGAAGSAHSSAV